MTSSFAPIRPLCRSAFRAGSSGRFRGAAVPPLAVGCGRGGGFSLAHGRRWLRGALVPAAGRGRRCAAPAWARRCATLGRFAPRGRRCPLWLLGLWDPPPLTPQNSRAGRRSRLACRGRRRCAGGGALMAGAVNVVAFSGARRLNSSQTARVAELAPALTPAGAAVLVGCAPGVDARGAGTLPRRASLCGRLGQIWRRTPGLCPPFSRHGAHAGSCRLRCAAGRFPDPPLPAWRCAGFLLALRTPGLGHLVHGCAGRRPRLRVAGCALGVAAAARLGRRRLDRRRRRLALGAGAFSSVVPLLISGWIRFVCSTGRISGIPWHIVFLRYFSLIFC